MLSLKTPSPNIKRLADTVLIILCFSFVFSFFSVEIWDPDFWWHLKTGEYIYQTKSLPDSDPFSYTSFSGNLIHQDSKRITFILSQYWLAQLVFFLIYKAFSFQGIIYLRASILTLSIFLIYKSILMEGIPLFKSILLLIPVVIIFSGFTGERPQLFFFSAFLFIVLSIGEI